MTQAGGWKALLICPNRALRADLPPLLAQQLPLVPLAELDVYPPRQALAELVREQRVNLCFLDVTSDQKRGTALIGELLACQPSMQVVVLLTDKEQDLLRYLRLGASEFLLSPISAEQLQSAVDRLAKLNPNGAGLGERGKVYCVMPAKGACGASTIACNLAFQLKKLGGKRLLLADLDPLTGTQGFLLKLKSMYSFIDAVTRDGALDGDVWRALVTSSNGIDVLLSPDSPIDALSGGLDPTALVEFSRQSYDSVVLDAAGAYGKWSLSLASLCDELLLVATNELPSLLAAQRVVSYFDRNRVDRSKLRLVINRYNREVGLSREMIETVLHTEVFQLIPSDYEAVQRALIEGKLIPPNAAFGKSLLALAERLAGVEESSASAVPQRVHGLGKLFTRLLRRN